MKKQREIVCEPLINLSLLAEKTGLTEAFLRKLKDHRGMPHYKIGSLVRYKLSEVQSWIEQRKVG